MIVLVSGIVFLSVFPLSLIVLWRNQAVVLDKTFEVCNNLVITITNFATEELLINETYDATRTALTRLKSGNITGLLDSYVVNIDGVLVAELVEKRIGTKLSSSEISNFKNINKLVLNEKTKLGKTILEFSSPIFIQYKGKSMRVGTAVFEFDKDDVYSPIREIRQTIILVASVLFAIGILIALLAAISFSRPIQILSHGAELIGRGDLNYRIPIHSRDEIGQLATNFNNMTHKIQDFTQNLEDKVAQRTDELNNTLKEVQALKIAQDGDYYLTSLLLQPLQMNNNSSSLVKTDFFMEQKKKFSFRKWDSQIGGDICLTDTIRLQDREYTVFLNGDAMGKSIQGAGGALVLGVVFNSSIIRTQISKNQNIFPEVWLKEKFLDLQNVFLSFNGSMYISVCMGLIDNVSGLMYYINAEHPWTVLYRDGKASFLEEELEIRKIGTPEQEEKFFVRLFQLAPGDVVITGSDGRDDLLMKMEGNESIELVNEDETQFLRIVEEGKGEIIPMVSKIQNTGTLIDDLSILRISFSEDNLDLNLLPSPAYESLEKVETSSALLQQGDSSKALQVLESVLHTEKPFPELLKLMGKIYFNNNEYERALECFLQYIDLYPSDNEYLYAISNCYRSLGKLVEAADYGERLFLRDRRHFINLISLASIYRDSKIFPRAKYMIDKALELNPEDETAKSILEDIRAEYKEEPETINPRQFVFYNERPTSWEEILKFADEYYQSKKYQDALHNYLNAYTLDKEHPWVLFRVANCYSLLGNLSEAEKFYQLSLQLAPKNYHALNNLGSIYFRMNKYEKARSAWNQAIEIKPDFQTAITNLERLDKKDQISLAS